MKKIALLLILLAGILWGSMGLFVRRLNGMGLGSIEMVALRAIVTCIVLFGFLLIYNWELLLIRIKDLWCFLGTGIFSVVFFNFCYFKAISMTSMAVAAVLLYTAPAIVMVISYVLFGEKFTKRKLVSLGMTFVGCVLVTGTFSATGMISVLGVFTGLGAGLGYGLYSIFSRYALEKGYHSLTITFYTFFIAALATCLLADIGQVKDVVTNQSSMLLFFMAFGVVCTVLPYIMYTLGLQYVENSRAAIIASIEPVTATILGVLVFAEAITIDVMVGIVLVLVALVICNKKVTNG